eukprot:jgi/Orpsp1_1/1177524/evm.model.c7180000061789.1
MSSENIVDVKDNSLSESLLKKKNKKEKTNKVTYFSLFKYSSFTEKLMIVFGLLGSFTDGITLPLTTEVMNKLINIFIKLSTSIFIRDFLDIQNNDEIIIDFFEVLSRMNRTEIKEFISSNDDFNKQSTISNLMNSDMSLTNFLKTSSQFITEKDFWSEINKNVIQIFIIAIIAFCGSFIMECFLKISSGRQVTKIRELTFKSIINQDITWHESKSPGELSSMIISNSMKIEDGIGTKLGRTFKCISIFISSYCFALIIQKYTAELGGIAQEAFSQIRTIVSFGTEKKEVDRYSKKVDESRKFDVIKGHIFGASIGIAFCIIYSSYSIAFIYGSRFINNCEMKHGDVVSVALNVMRGAMSLSGVGVNIGAFSDAVCSAAILFKIIENKPKINVDDGEISEEPLKGTIEFQNVHFSYPSRPEVEVLKGISFKCLPGQTVAIIGTSGSGKSTCIQLLERFYNLKSGRILVDGKDIEDYNVHWLRSQFGIVFQDPVLFDTTIAKNISIACPYATQKQIEEAAKLANAHDFILKLQNGYNTGTGERGLQLSGGQKQRISIARALISNPKILLLDEATSALDNKSEKEVQVALNSAASNRTTIVIAHRLSTIKNADRIIVMEKGVIVESGTHEELMKLQNHYYNLVKNQELLDNNNKNEDTDSNESNAEDELHQSQYFQNPYNNNESLLSNDISTSSQQLLNQNYGKFEEKEDEDEKQKRSYDLKDMPWKRFIKYCNPYWLSNLIGYTGTFMIAVLQTSYSFIFSSAISSLSKQGDELIKAGSFWGSMFIIIGILYFYSFYANIGGFYISGKHVSYDLQKYMYDSIIHQEVGFFDTNDIGDINADLDSSSSPGFNEDEVSNDSGSLTAKLIIETGRLDNFNSNIGVLIQISLTLLFGLIVALISGYKLTIIILAFAPMLIIGQHIGGVSYKYINKISKKALEVSTKVTIEAVSCIKTVYALNINDYYIKEYNKKLNESTSIIERTIYLASMGSSLNNSLIYIAFIIGFWFGAILIENREMTFDGILKVMFSIIFSTSDIGNIKVILADIRKAVSAFINIIEIIDRNPKINVRDVNGIKKDDGSFKGNLEFNNIHFSYPSRPDVSVLHMDDKKITIPEGKMCAFVGISGSGKSTILGLLLRWYDTQRGSIKVDDIENKNYNIKWLREQIGIVNQEPSLFNISIKENIKYGKLDATDEEIYEAAKKANIHKFIMSLPDKYDTLVGSVGTSQLSGGQKQRIAIARALIRNPKILLLDEATSALDSESELIVQKALDDAIEGRTTIAVAHRLSTIKNADIIYVFKEGTIIESGNHNELIEKKGEYYNMLLAGENSISEMN